jgi:hypothetical protein
LQIVAEYAAFFAGIINWIRLFQFRPPTAFAGALRYWFFAACVGAVVFFATLAYLINVANNGPRRACIRAMPVETAFEGLRKGGCESNLKRWICFLAALERVIFNGGIRAGVCSGRGA